MQTALARLDTLRALAMNVTRLDPDGTIVDTDATWRDVSPANGATLPDGGRGLNYLSLCPPERARQIEALIDGHCDLFTCVYPCRSSRDKSWMLLIAIPVADSRPRGVTLLHVNLSSLLPFEPARDELRVLHSPEAVPGATLDAIVHAIEDTIARSMGQGRAALAGFAAGHDGQTGIRANGSNGSHGTNGNSNGNGHGAGERRADHPAGSEPLSIVEQLPRRQRQVFGLLGEGRSNGEIAEALGISANTAKLHVAAVLRRLGLDNRMQAVALAARVMGELH